jgi:uncharacterized protein with PQ loop repeat
MKKIITIIALALSTYTMQAQNITSYKTKNTANEEARTSMLDQLRNYLYVEYSLETQFKVTKLNVSGNYAWLTVTALDKNGKPLVLKNPEDDCCHAEALYKKEDGLWTMVEKAAFSTDVWYEALTEKYNLPAALFSNE